VKRGESGSEGGGEEKREEEWFHGRIRSGTLGQARSEDEEKMGLRQMRMRDSGVNNCLRESESHPLIDDSRFLIFEMESANGQAILTSLARAETSGQ
jgi:hypothetical protein